MATAATEEQIKKLEASLYEELYFIVQSLTFRKALVDKVGESAEAVKKYNRVIFPIVNNWIQREGAYERILLKKGFRNGLLASGSVKYADFTNYSKLPELWALVNRVNKEKTLNGIGFLPLLIWPIVWIVGLVSAAFVADEITTTTQEKQQLINATSIACSDARLTPDQCKALLTQTQQEASKGSDLGDTIKYAILGYLALQIIPTLSKSK